MCVDRTGLKRPITMGWRREADFIMFRIHWVKTLAIKECIHTQHFPRMIQSSGTDLAVESQTTPHRRKGASLITQPSKEVCLGAVIAKNALICLEDAGTKQTSHTSKTCIDSGCGCIWLLCFGMTDIKLIKHKSVNGRKWLWCIAKVIFWALHTQKKATLSQWYSLFLVS